jgi:hypothetical protein
MTRGKKNLPASIAARLLDQARLHGDDYQLLLTRFLLERFLHRLGESDLRDRFILKGAMLFRLWSDQPYRATRDLDLLRRGDGAFDAIGADLIAICSVPVEPDGVEFDADGIRLEAIRAEDEYAGTRARLPARCGSARIALQVDMGLGDSVWPAPNPCVYPVLLDFARPEILAYPREAVIAEKLEAMVVLGDRNSRIKDFFDVHHLASQFEFDRETLAGATQRTFDRRRTPIPADRPVGLTTAYWENPSRPAQVRAFARRARLPDPGIPGGSFARLLADFLLPILNDLRDGAVRVGTWPPGGPWRDPSR